MRCSELHHYHALHCTAFTANVLCNILDSAIEHCTIFHWKGLHCCSLHCCEHCIAFTGSESQYTALSWTVHCTVVNSTLLSLGLEVSWLNFCAVHHSISDIVHCNVVHCIEVHWCTLYCCEQCSVVNSAILWTLHRSEQCNALTACGSELTALLCSVPQCTLRLCTALCSALKYTALLWTLHCTVNIVNSALLSLRLEVSWLHLAAASAHASASQQKRDCQCHHDNLSRW